MKNCVKQFYNRYYDYIFCITYIAAVMFFISFILLAVKTWTHIDFYSVYLPKLVKRGLAFVILGYVAARMEDKHGNKPNKQDK